MPFDFPSRDAYSWHPRWCHHAVNLSFAVEVGKGSDPEDVVQQPSIAFFDLLLPPHHPAWGLVSSKGKTRPTQGLLRCLTPQLCRGRRERRGISENQQHSRAPDSPPSMTLQSSVASALAPIRSAWRGIWEEVRGGSAGPTLLRLCWKWIPTYGVQMGHSPFSRLQPANKLSSSWGGEPPEPHVL